MKRITAFLLTALLLLSLVACGGKGTWQEQYDLGMRYLNEGNYQEAVIAFTAAIEIDAKRPEAYLGAAEAYVGLGDYVSAAEVLQRCYDETGVETAREQANDICTQWLVTDAYAYDTDQTIWMYDVETGLDQELPLAFHIPQVNLESTDAEAVNREIYNTLYPNVQKAISVIGSYEVLECGSIAYRAVVNGDILSLLVISSMYPYESPSTSYLAYNFSLSKGTLLTTEAVAAAAGYTVDDYTLRARQAMGSYIHLTFPGETAQNYGDVFVQELNNDLDRTLSDENVQNGQLFLDEKGNLRLVAALYWPVANGRFTLLLNLTDFQLVEGYDQAFETPEPEEIRLTEDEAKELAYQYWDYTPGDVDSETGYRLGVFSGEMQQELGKNYYIFWMRWLVDGTHWSTVDAVMVDASTGECARYTYL